jgi:hypothetical protein
VLSCKSEEVRITRKLNDKTYSKNDKREIIRTGVITIIITMRRKEQLKERNNNMGSS